MNTIPLVHLLVPFGRCSVLSHRTFTHISLYLAALLYHSRNCHVIVYMHTYSYLLLLSQRKSHSKRDLEGITVESLKRCIKLYILIHNAHLFAIIMYTRHININFQKTWIWELISSFFLSTLQGYLSIALVTRETGFGWRQHNPG